MTHSRQHAHSLLALVALVLVIMSCGPSGQVVPTKKVIPTQKATPFLVVLCKFKSKISAAASYEPYPVSWIQTFISETGKGQHGLYDYWQTNSLGEFDLTGSKAIGWFQMQGLAAAYITDYNTSVSPKSPDEVSDAARSECTSHAQAEITANPGKYVGIIDVFNYNSSWCRTRYVEPYSFGTILIEMDPRCISVSTFAHEMGHAYGLPHTFAVKTTDDPHSAGHTWGTGRYLEYGDPWDIMSNGQVIAYADPVWGSSGPELAAPYRYTLGFIPATRIYTFATSTQTKATVRVQAIDRAFQAGNNLIAYYPLSSYAGYMVEYRATGGYDQNLKDQAVLIYEFTHPDDAIGDQVASLIMPDRGATYDFQNNYLDAQNAEWKPGDTFYDKANGVEIDVVSFNSDSSATLNLVRTNPVGSVSPLATPPPSGPMCYPNCASLPARTFSRLPPSDFHIHTHPFRVGFLPPAPPVIPLPAEVPSPTALPTATLTPPPHLAASASSFGGGCFGTGQPGYPMITLTNSGAGAAHWLATTNDATHVSVVPASGTVAPAGVSAQVTLSGTATVSTLVVTFTVAQQGTVTVSVSCGKP